MGYIYKITNTISGKCYIGETVRPNPQTRWKQHIYKINKDDGCPALRDAIKKYGIDKFKFEVLIICFDEDRHEYEKEYINKYNCQVPNGYNILPGGQYGGSRLGIKHTEEAKKKMSDACKAYYKDNPNHYETIREKHKEAMEKVDLSTSVKNSNKFKKAVEEGRVGGKAHKDGKQSEETKKKIRESLLKYYEENLDSKKLNIEKHREAMAKSKGRKVAQYSKDNKFIKEYKSISEAGRLSSVKAKNISSVLCGRTKTACGYIWKYVDEKDLKTSLEV
jgi:group I intron endonuclease